MMQVEAKELEAELALRADRRVPTTGVEYVCVQGVDGLRDAGVLSGMRAMVARVYSSVPELRPFSLCEGCSSLLIPALRCPISGGYSAVFAMKMGFWRTKTPIFFADPRERDEYGFR